MASNSSSAIQGMSGFQDIQAISAANPEGGQVGLVISEITHQGKLNLRCDTAFHKKATKIFGINTNPENNLYNNAGDRYAVWLGPDEVLLLSEAGSEAQLVKQISDLAGKAHMAINDVSDALVSMRLKGHAVRNVLAKGCALDLHKAHFTKGMAAQTILSHAGVILLCVGDDEFIVIGRTSFTAYIVSYLADASVEFGYEVVA